jgi:hypothetical protein
MSKKREKEKKIVESLIFPAAIADNKSSLLQLVQYEKRLHHYGTMNLIFFSQKRKNEV